MTKETVMQKDIVRRMYMALDNGPKRPPGLWVGR